MTYKRSPTGVMIGMCSDDAEIEQTIDQLGLREHWTECSRLCADDNDPMIQLSDPMSGRMFLIRKYEDGLAMLTIPLSADEVTICLFERLCRALDIGFTGLLWVGNHVRPPKS